MASVNKPPPSKLIVRSPPARLRPTVDRRSGGDRQPGHGGGDRRTVQGEGGARALSGEWLLRLRALTRQHGVLLIHDEVQSGMGRTGRLFAHQWFDGAAPDIMALAKALGSGFPVGACLATAEAAKGMTPGVHGTTFGGNPLAMAVGIAAFDTIANEETPTHARAASADFFERLEALRTRFPDVIAEVRGKGLLTGLKMIPNNREFMGIARDHGILVAGGGENCVRLLPSLLISRRRSPRRSPGWKRPASRRAGTWRRRRERADIDLPGDGRDHLDRRTSVAERVAIARAYADVLTAKTTMH